MPHMPRAPKLLQLSQPTWIARLSRHFAHPYISLLAAILGGFTLFESAYSLIVSPFDAFDLLLLAARIAAIVAFVARPAYGAWLIVVSVLLDSLTPNPTPATMLINALVAVATQGFLNMALGGVLSLLLIVVLGFGLTIGFDSDMGNGGIVSFAVFIFISYGIGILTNVNGRHRAQEQQNLLLRHNALIAQRLHDYTTNDMNNIIMLVDLVQGGSSRHNPAETLRLVRENAVNALAQTRQAILTLRSDGVEYPQIDWMNHDGLLPSSDLNARLTQLIDEQQEILDSLGFQGTVLMPTPMPNATQIRSLLIEALVKELFGNIAQHAAPAGGYTMTIGANDDDCEIGLSDTPLGAMTSPAQAAAGTGTGMATYHATITSIGGSWNVEEGESSWTLSARIPWSNTAELANAHGRAPEPGRARP
jgi:signal transduction histidine kinase